MKYNTVFIFLLLWIMPVLAFASDTDKAKAFFQKYQQYESTFSPAIAEMYADTAQIQNRRIYPDGRVKVMTIPASDYKNLIRKVMPLAKARNDRNTYSKITYRNEKNGVRIITNRHSELKDYDSPYSLLVGPTQSGDWKILEEHSVSRP